MFVKARQFRRNFPHLHPAFGAPRTVAVPLTSLRVFDAVQTNLPGTAANDDMGIVGTGATVAVTLQGVDFGGVATDEKAMFELCLPDTYNDGDKVSILLKAGMLTAVSDTVSTVDVIAFRDLGDGTISADLVTTAAQSINSLTLADKAFVVNPATLVAGQRLFVQIAFIGNDVGNLAVMIPTITKIEAIFPE